LLAYLKASPTAFHAIDASTAMLGDCTRLQENEPWKLVPGGRYYVTRNRSSLIAFTLPQGDFEGFQIVASHSDSPCFNVKENAELKVRDKYVQLDVERYGGMLMASWFDRPLSVAGRVMVRTAEGIETRLVNVDRDLVMIPNVAIHMNREVNDGFKYNAAVDTMPLYGSIADKDTFRATIAEAAGVPESTIIGTDLYLYNRMPGTVWGAAQEYISAGRLDDLECAFTSLCAIRTATPEKHVNVCCIFDNEEVGSLTKQGADSTFLRDVLERIAACTKKSVPMQQLLSSSFMLSADNAHATHPNHPELSDPVNQVWMNEGVVVKFNARQKYTTDASSLAIFRAICDHAQVPLQYFANRSDMLGGSTLGNLSNAHVSVNTVDIGLPQLAMHSSYETAGVHDVDAMIRAMHAFYCAEITTKQDGEWSLEMK